MEQRMSATYVEESPDTTGHDGGQHPLGAIRRLVPQKVDRLCFRGKGERVE